MRRRRRFRVRYRWQEEGETSRILERCLNRRRGLHEPARKRNKVNLLCKGSGMCALLGGRRKGEKGGDGTAAALVKAVQVRCTWFQGMDGYKKGRNRRKKGRGNRKTEITYIFLVVRSGKNFVLFSLLYFDCAATHFVPMHRPFQTWLAAELSCQTRIPSLARGEKCILWAASEKRRAAGWVVDLYELVKKPSCRNRLQGTN